MSAHRETAQRKRIEQFMGEFQCECEEKIVAHFLPSSPSPSMKVNSSCRPIRGGVACEIVGVARSSLAAVGICAMCHIVMQPYIQISVYLPVWQLERDELGWRMDVGEGGDRCGVKTCFRIN